MQTFLLNCIVLTRTSSFPKCSCFALFMQARHLRISGILQNLCCCNALGKSSRSSHFHPNYSILVLPFATADCEKTFSVMNRIKSAERSRLKNILMDLMLFLYNITPAEKASLDITDLARKVLTNVWKYKKKDLFRAELRANVNENYVRIFI